SRPKGDKRDHLHLLLCWPSSSSYSYSYSQLLVLKFHSHSRVRERVPLRCVRVRFWAQQGSCRKQLRRICIPPFPIPLLALCGRPPHSEPERLDWFPMAFSDSFLLRIGVIFLREATGVTPVCSNGAAAA